VVCERKNLEAQDLSFAPFRAGDVLRALVPRAARWLAAQVTAVTRWPLGWIMLAFQARLSMLFLCTSLLIAPPSYVSFDCTRVFVLNFVHSYIIVAVKKRRAGELNSWRMVEVRSRFESEMTIPIELEGSKAGR